MSALRKPIKGSQGPRNELQLGPSFSACVAPASIPWSPLALVFRPNAPGKLHGRWEKYRKNDDNSARRTTEKIACDDSPQNGFFFFLF